jgi:UDP-N-acetyl-D-galactosamine dehydrogenase
VHEIRARLEAKAAPIGIVGLGYVGLPLACLLAARYRVVGFDINATRLEELRSGLDRSQEVTEKAKLLNPNLSFCDDAAALRECPLIIVAVPTPVDAFNVPDLTPVSAGSITVGRNLAPGTVVVYESTVYPGLTETVCRKHLEAESGMKLNEGFFLGYSPERVVPGDKQRTIEKITKIVAGSTPAVTNLLAAVYGSVIPAGIHRASSIAVAEAAKVIENAQRDLNIAFVNELAILFDRIGIDTLDVLEAAGTKWNFLPFRPGLVGGHCIGVDPFYLTHLAESMGMHTQVISAGRRINDAMGAFVAKKTVSLILSSPKPPRGKLNVAVLGITFKENVPDIRNSKVASLANELESYGIATHIVDPLADPHEVQEEYGKRLVDWNDLPVCDAIVVAVTHDIFRRDYPLERLSEKLSPSRIIVDLKGIYRREDANRLGTTLWRL